MGVGISSALKGGITRIVRWSSADRGLRISRRRWMVDGLRHMPNTQGGLVPLLIPAQHGLCLLEQAMFRVSYLVRVLGTLLAIAESITLILRLANNRIWF